MLYLAEPSGMTFTSKQVPSSGPPSTGPSPLFNHPFSCVAAGINDASDVPSSVVCLGELEQAAHPIKRIDKQYFTNKNRMVISIKDLKIHIKSHPRNVGWLF